ncbi:Rossmann fold nucleotide-binding protein Smf possibly involved in DNA uptake [hydrothermal vent metagenome]|uniref:Rossmann fold nucleotide-binding protein Smf possibly involved in DNA uptake n=1 Tax=hydrothermal vent metagenome TaxID=652676 RepID=A0A3B0YJH5_9ZZZZ
MRSQAGTQDTEHRNSLFYWLALARVPGIGSSRITQVLETFGTPEAAFAASPEQLRQAGVPADSIDAFRHPDQQTLENDLLWSEAPDNHIICLTDPRYPQLLKEIPDPPPLLFVHGDPDYLSQPQLAIVGSRNPTPAGITMAQEFAAYLSSFGLTISSGMATGIDAAAHEGALGEQGGTLAVTGTGLDRVYPSCHHDLAHRIADNGALVSEFPPGTPPIASNFPRRNRIISGLSVGTLVVEAALRSGSLITARLARDQGREIFAIPGSIHNPLARGCHALIREGAKLVETGQHVLEELAPLVSAARMSDQTSAKQVAGGAPDKTTELAEDYRKLLDNMGYEPVSVDELVPRSGLTAEQLSSMLLVLELDGHLHSGAGGRYTRVR